MSTVFEVFPSKDAVPTFKEILVRANEHLEKFLLSYEIVLPVALDVSLRERSGEDDREVAIDRDGPAWWEKTQYAWFHVVGVPGGTDAYAMRWDKFHREVVTEEFAGKKGATVADLIAKSVEIGRSWNFRRSMGQPAIINIAYGLVAASLAELTEGFIHSSDNAWDYDFLPARPSEFLQWYFRPELALSREHRDWAEKCIRELMRVSEEG